MQHLLLPPSTHPYHQDQTLSLLHNCRSSNSLHQLHAISVKTGLIHSLPISTHILSLYSTPSIGSLDHARSIFNRIPTPDTFAWNTIIKAHVNARHSHAAIALFSDMLLQSSTPPDDFTLPCVIKGCAQLSAVGEGKQVHGLSFKTGLVSDRYVLTSLVSFYSKCGDLVSARVVFDGIVDRDLVVWNSLIDGYDRCGRIEDARSLFDEMPQRDAFSWVSLINGYSKCKEIEVARELFDRMPERNLVAWNAMIDGYMQCGEFGAARELFDRAPERNVVTWNSMIIGFEKMGRFEKALQVYEAMFREGIVPNTVTLIGALSAASGLALLDQGKSIHVYLSRNRFKLDGVLGTCLIEMYSKCGSIDDALSVFKKIHRKKVGHWTAMIMGLGMHGMAEDALGLFAEMEKIRMTPNAITFVGVLNACSHAGMVDEGRKYFELMSKRYEIRPELEHYGCIVDLLCRVGHLEEARNVIHQIPMRPNKIIWMSLLSGCRKFKNIEMGQFAAKHVIELDPNATGCYVLLSNIYAASGLWESVSKLREIMNNRGVRKDPGHSLVEYGGKIHKFIAGDRSHPQAAQIYFKLNEIGTRLKIAGYTPDVSQVLLCVKEGDKEAELAHHSERLAIGFSFINFQPGNPIRIVKNLRVCDDCHNVTKLISGIYSREIIVRDNSRFHHFKNGSCSCSDFW